MAVIGEGRNGSSNRDGSIKSSGDPYINALRAEIADLKAQNEILCSKLLINYERKNQAQSDLLRALTLINEM